MEQISVIIPSYNRADLIGRAIESVLVQSCQPTEVIIVDDGSEDNTEEVVRRMDDPRISYYRFDQNKGVSFARNKGVELATGKWIAFQDSDDIWRSNKLEEQVKYVEEHPEYGMVYCAYACHFTDGREMQIPGEDASELQGDLFASLIHKNVIGAPTIFMLKTDFEEVGGFDVSLRSLEDWEFVLRYAKDHRIGYVDQVLVDAYLSDSGVSSVAGAYFESRCKMIARYYRELTDMQQLDAAIVELFVKAEQNGILEQVKQMLFLYIHTAIQK